MLDFNNREKFTEYGSDITKRNNEEINKHEANINMIVGRRSNGKTYPTVTFDGIKRFIDSQYQDSFAYIRRYDSDIKLIAADLFNGCIDNGWLEWYTHGEFNNITYYRGKFYLKYINDDGEVERRLDTPMCYTFAINTASKSKGPDYPNIKTIIFDEFIPMRKERGYCPAELELWNNIISTIDRGRNGVKIYMLGNTITKDCPYFDYYHIDIDEIPQGKISVGKVGTIGKLAFEYCADTGDANTHESVYFNTDNATGAMILTGVWEIPPYPTLPKEYQNYEEYCIEKFYLLYKEKLIEGCILQTGNISTIYFHMYDDLIEEGKILYIMEWDNEAIDMPNVRVGFNTSNKFDKYILSKLSTYRCYYENNDVGDKVNYFIKRTNEL